MFSVHIIITCRYVFRKYYTDQHDVDENRNTIPVYGGMWMGDRATSDGTGIYRRDMYDPVDTVAHTVASLKHRTLLH